MHRSAQRHLLTRLLTGLIVAIGMTVLVGPAATASAEVAPGKTATGWIRAGHLAAGTDKADIRLTPFAGGAPATLRSVSYGSVTDYERVDEGLYTVAVLPAGAAENVTPMVTKSVRVDAGAAITVIATGDAEDVTAQVINDDLTPPPPGQAKVRLISAASGVDTVEAQVVGGPLLAKGVTTGSATGYATVDAQIWSVEVNTEGARSASMSSRVRVEAGGVYTLLVVDKATGGLELQAVKDSSGSAEMPAGGVDTGAGGLASGERHDTSGATTLPLPVAGSSALILAIAGLGILAGRSPRSGTR